MGFSHVQEIKRWAVKLHFLEHGPHIVVLVHELVGIPTAVEYSPWIQDWKRNHGVRSVAQGVLKKGWEKHPGNEGFELNVFQPEPLVELKEVLLVILRRVHVFRALMRHESDEKIVLRWGGPGGVRPALLDLPKLLEDSRARCNEGVIAATV